MDVPKVGIVCGKCGGKLTIRSSYRPRPNVKIRYKVCLGCGAKATTRETLVVPASKHTDLPIPA